MSQLENSQSFCPGEYYDYAKFLAGKLYRKWNFYNVDLEDLEGAALLGLCEAAGRYDSELNDSFKSFSYLRVQGAVFDQVKKESHHSFRTKRPHVAKEYRDKDSAKKTDSSVVSHRELSQLLNTFDALNFDLLGSEKGAACSLVYRDQENAEEILSKSEQDDILRRLISDLSDDERQVIYQYYYEGKKFGEMEFSGKTRSRSWVCRKHAQAIESLKSGLEKEKRAAFRVSNEI